MSGSTSSWKATPDSENAPMWAIVRGVGNPLILDMGNRARRLRAWVRFGAVCSWLALALVSGSSRWPWTLPWLFTIGVTVLHAYRDEVISWSHRIHSARIARWLLPAYSDDVGLNTPGRFDIAGNLLGGVAAGQCLGALNFMHVFDPNNPHQGPAAAASVVLAAVALLGGLSVALHHYNWHNRMQEDAAGSYTRAWNVIAVGLTVLIFVLLWPGAPRSPGFSTRLVLDIAAVIAAAFTAYYGRADITRRITYVIARLDEVKKEVRLGDSVPVHSAKNRVAELAGELMRGGHSDVGQRVQHEALRLEELQVAMELDDDGKPRNASDLYARWFREGRVSRDWAGVVADLDPATLLPKDSSFMEDVLESFRSNAVKARATELVISWVVRQTSSTRSELTLSATCSCRHLFDGDALPGDSSLRHLEARVASYNGKLEIVELQHAPPGCHTLTMIWPTYSAPRPTPPTWKSTQGGDP